MEFRKISDDEHYLVMEHLRESFFKDSPLIDAFRCSPESISVGVLEQDCFEMMKQRLSIAAYENGKVLGVSLNGIVKPGDVSKALIELTSMKIHPNEKKIYTFLYNSAEKLDLFTKYNVDELFECSILSVDRKSRGRGIGNELMKRSIQLAKESGYKLFKSDTTSIFSEKICRINGLSVISELKYKDYLDPETSLPVFDVAPPHDAFKIMVLELKES